MAQNVEQKPAAFIQPLGGFGGQLICRAARPVERKYTVMQAQWVVLFGFVFDKAIGHRPGGKGERDQKGGYEMSHAPNLRRAAMKFNNTQQR